MLCMMDVYLRDITLFFVVENFELNVGCLRICSSFVKMLLNNEVLYRGGEEVKCNHDKYTS